MDRLLLFLAATAPGILLLTYGVAKTRTSFGNEALWTSFMMGGVAAIGAAVIGFAMSKVLDTFGPGAFAKGAIEAFFIAGTVEEIAKFVVVVGIAESHVDARRIQDILALSLAAALGFATMENLLYVVEPANWRAVAGLRSITAVPGHAVDGLTMGALITAARLRPHARAVWLAAALALPILFHGAYDFPLMISDALDKEIRAIIWFAVLVVTAIVCIVLCNSVLPKAAEADARSGRDTSGDISGVRSLAIAAILLLGGPVVGVFSASAFATATRTDSLALVWGAGIVLSLLPIIFGVDLMWSLFRRQREARRLAQIGPETVFK